MIEQLEGIDRSLVLAINSIHSSWLDEFMWLVSGKLIWFPFYLLLLFLFFKKSNIRLTFIFLLCAIAVVALADQLSVHLFKNVFERYRPSHHALLTDKLHFYQLQDGNFYKGGMFGFVSSHAANFFGICSFAFLASSISLILCNLLASFAFIRSSLFLSCSALFSSIFFCNSILFNSLSSIFC